jgi:hypothetical protein
MQNFWILPNILRINTNECTNHMYHPKIQVQPWFLFACMWFNLICALYFEPWEQEDGIEDQDCIINSQWSKSSKIQNQIKILHRKFTSSVTE